MQMNNYVEGSQLESSDSGMLMWQMGQQYRRPHVLGCDRGRLYGVLPPDIHTFLQSRTTFEVRPYTLLVHSFLFSEIKYTILVTLHGLKYCGRQN
jgi:hypothetical protein